LNVLDLFSGIGGFSLGLERAGMRTVAFCEIDPYCRAVLRKHWPGVPCFDDVRKLNRHQLVWKLVDKPRRYLRRIPLSGHQHRLDRTRDRRRSQWPLAHYARLIGELRPRYVIVENVAALLARGLGRVLGDLATLGYDAEWHCIPASAVGAPHERDRIWIVAYPDVRQRQRPNRPVQAGRNAISRGGEDVADSDSLGCDEMEQPEHGGSAIEGPILAALYASLAGGRTGWEAEPDVGRVADGIPARVDRLKGLGNAVVPEIPEIIGRVILAYEGVTA
jgi:DNA (cytosine-5)-methyltransferase 1